MDDNMVLKHIEQLVTDEEHLYSKGNLSDAEIKKLENIKVELDRYWDFLRQRRSLRNAGDDPANAHLRSADVVKNYKE